MVFNNQQAGFGGTGGGIYNAFDATLTLSQTLVTENSSTQSGGGIANLGTLQVRDGSRIYLNWAPFGGGLLNAQLATTTIFGFSQVYNNSASMPGGGVYISGGNVAMSGGAIYGNSAQNNGGGIYVSTGSLTLTGGVTIGPNNRATNGGGLYLGKNSTTTFNGCTISGNEAQNGAGYYQQIGAAINVIQLNNPDGSIQGN